MKFQLCLFLSLATTGAEAFAPPRMMISSRLSSSSSARFLQDSASAVQEAMAASEQYGKTSPEARAAWDIVEELDAANSHERKRAQEIELKKAELECLMEQVSETPPAAAATPLTKDTSDLVKTALEMSRVHGKTSTEARLAWEAVEEMDASNSHRRPSVSEPEDPCIEPVGVVKEAQDAKAASARSSLVKTNPETVDEAIATAMFLNKVYGARATETRLAWELVEEMEAEASHQRAQKEEKEAAAAAAAAEATKKGPAIPISTVHVDSESAIAAAMKATETFGATSKEARLAWEEVEEMDATNSHHKTVGSG